MNDHSVYDHCYFDKLSDIPSEYKKAGSELWPYYIESHAKRELE